MPVARRNTAARVVIGASDSFASAPVLNALAYLVGQMTAIQSVSVGAQLAVSTRVSAAVSLGQLQPEQKFAGPDVMQRTIRVLVGFLYKVEGSESSAEAVIGAAVDAFEVAFYRQRPSELFGTIRDMKLDVSVADDPAYQGMAGQEVRFYPIVVIGVQRTIL